MSARGVNLLTLGVAVAASLGGAGGARAGPTSRAHCDSAVERLFALADRRLALMPQVAAWKWQHHAAITAPAREQAVIQQSGQLAGPLGLSPPAVERLFALQVRLAREEESRLQLRWRTQGFDYRGAAPSLTAVLRPQLDGLTTQLLMALGAAAPELARHEFVSEETLCAASVLHAEGWSAAGRLELLRDLHAIGAASFTPRHGSVAH